MGRRITAEDTVDNATHVLHRLQSDGWAAKTVNVEFDHAKHGALLPVKATVTIVLIPAKP